jgi:hypothetical protein
MTLVTYASGSGALSFTWQWQRLRHGRMQVEAASNPVSREDAATLLKDGWELFNEGGELYPKWVQCQLVGRQSPEVLMLEGRPYQIVPLEEGDLGRHRFRSDIDGDLLVVRNLAIISSLRYYLTHEAAILAQRAAA